MMMLQRASGLPSRPACSSSPFRGSLHAPRRNQVFVRVEVPGKQERLERATQEALKRAELECRDERSESKDCSVAWDQAEELLAHKAHQAVKREEKESLDQYCEDQPDADECRVYES